MIQANELRVGNWVKRNDLEGVFTIRGVCKDRVHPIALIDHDNVNNVHYACECTLYELDPICLTPEILEKCGFILHENGLYVVNGFWISFKHGAFTPVYCDGSSFARFIGVHISHLHQLQNLYFALTGEELNVQL